MPDSTRTAAEAAAACGCTVGQIIKSLIFKGKDSDRPYLFLVSGDNPVDEEAVAQIIG
jgi:prolyl-tRNA editing enzyme YbaK/EbsC (Cys-tRNA(Pro) deacylase)